MNRSSCPASCKLSLHGPATTKMAVPTPALGRAALIDGNAPGVAPVQSTTNCAFANPGRAAANSIAKSRLRTKRMENGWLDIELLVFVKMESSIALLFNGLSIGVLQVGRFLRREPTSGRSIFHRGIRSNEPSKRRNRPHGFGSGQLTDYAGGFNGSTQH